MQRCLACFKFVPDWQTRCQCGGDVEAVAPLPKSSGPESLSQIRDRLLSRLVVTKE